MHQETIVYICINIKEQWKILAYTEQLTPHKVLLHDLIAPHNIFET